ncbi:MAG: hypothetical protein ACXWQE_11745 [Bdellovibrionales bacterium]
MKKVSLLLLLSFFSIFSFEALAQQVPPADQNYMTFLPDSNAPSRIDWFVSVSYLRWNEELRLQKNTLLDTGTSNFTGMSLNFERRKVYKNWGWSGEASMGAGRANGGGNSALIPYGANNQKWTSFGVGMKGFYRLSPLVSLGASIPLLMRNITWTSPDGVTLIRGGENLNLGLLLDIFLRLDRNLEFYQEIGALNAQGSTLWRFGLNYRFR